MHVRSPARWKQHTTPRRRLTQGCRPSNQRISWVTSSRRQRRHLHLVLRRSPASQRGEKRPKVNQNKVQQIQVCAMVVVETTSEINVVFVMLVATRATKRDTFLKCVDLGKLTTMKILLIP